MANITIYADAARAGKTGRYCCLITGDGPARMEQKNFLGASLKQTILLSAIHVLQSLQPEHKIEFLARSSYLVKGMRDKLMGWKERGWRHKSGSPLEDADLWERLDQAAQKHQISWFHSRGGHDRQQFQKVTDQLKKAGRRGGKQKLKRKHREGSFGPSWQRHLPQSIKRCDTCGCSIDQEGREGRYLRFCSPECRSAFAR